MVYTMNLVDLRVNGKGILLVVGEESVIKEQERSNM